MTTEPGARPTTRTQAGTGTAKTAAAANAANSVRRISARPGGRKLLSLAIIAAIIATAGARRSF